MKSERHRHEGTGKKVTKVSKDLLRSSLGRSAVTQRLPSVRSKFSVVPSTLLKFVRMENFLRILEMCFRPCTKIRPARALGDVAISTDDGRVKSFKAWLSRLFFFSLSRLARVLFRIPKVNFLQAYDRKRWVIACSRSVLEENIDTSYVISRGDVENFALVNACEFTAGVTERRLVSVRSAQSGCLIRETWVGQVKR